jgi:MFS superfamily sulfate permease-like transporter
MFVFMIFSTSRECVIGPVSLVSLLTAEAITATMPELQALADPLLPLNVSGLHFDNSEAAALNMATVLALLVGILQIGFAALGIGQVVMSVISDPFVSGFTTGTAVVIAVSQLSGVFGVKKGARTDVVLVTIYDVLKKVGEGDANWGAFTIAILCFAVLVVCQHLNKTVLQCKFPIPGELIVIVVCIISWPPTLVTSRRPTTSPLWATSRRGCRCRPCLASMPRYFRHSSAPPWSSRL